MSPIHGASTETNSLLGALSSKRDSTYSSMSEYSGRTSPTNSCRSSVGDSVGSGVGSPVGGEAQGHLSFGVQYVVTSPESNTGKLVITVLEARGLTGREYLGNACDPYVKVVVWKERRSLRKQKSPPLHVFRTRTVRHTQDPTFNQSFVIEAAKSDLKELVVKLVAMDSDKWASPSTDLGEVLFGLSYLPTAQRLSVSVIKAQNLKHTNVVDDLKDFCRVIKKKKTTWRSNTASPIWNETLIFDLAQSQVEHVTFLLVVCTRPQLPVTPTNSDASLQSTETFHDNSLSLAPPDLNSSSLHDQNQNKKQDRYVGKLALGCNVRSNDQRQHWMAIMASPRKVVSQWHGLK
ncbi:Synaptotagmin-3-like [Homarus americanus]|uniref:Synaptotagmin-3-like n=1 Tax=Homarus americanus TaxID=6706 RepID=A0A8J5JSD7_HOMAM|nr:Synaptotagmin-3-like [Homarus americanus]